jgi:hypothetical protein
LGQVAGSVCSDSLREKAVGFCRIQPCGRGTRCTSPAAGLPRRQSVAPHGMVHAISPSHACRLPWGGSGPQRGPSAPRAAAGLPRRRSRRRIMARRPGPQRGHVAQDFLKIPPGTANCCRLTTRIARTRRTPLPALPRQSPRWRRAASPSPHVSSATRDLRGCPREPDCATGAQPMPAGIGERLSSGAAQAPRKPA